MAKKYNFKKTAWKFGKAALAVILAGLLANYGNSSWYLAIVPLLAGLNNWIKHK